MQQPTPAQTVVRLVRVTAEQGTGQRGVQDTQALLRGMQGAITGTRSRDASTHDAGLRGAACLNWRHVYTMHPSSLCRFVLPRLAERRQRAGVLLLAPAAAQPSVLRPVPTTCCTSCGWRPLDGCGTWWRKHCNPGGRRGQELAAAWERPPRDIPPGRGTGSGIRSQPGIGLLLRNWSADATGERVLGNLVLGDFSSMSRAPSRAIIRHFILQNAQGWLQPKTTSSHSRRAGWRGHTARQMSVLLVL